MFNFERLKANLYVFVVVIPAILPILLSWVYGAYREHKGMKKPWYFSITITTLMIASLLFGWFTAEIFEENTITIQLYIITILFIIVISKFVYSLWKFSRNSGDIDFQTSLNGKSKKS